MHILEMGYNVMYNDVDMVWLGDPFRYLKGNHEVYFTDDMAVVCSANLKFYVSYTVYEVSLITS